MLTQQHTVLPAADLQRLRGFHHDRLGLDPREETGNGEGLKTQNGVAEGDGMRSAWFQDTEGNTVCITQRR